ncbi:energy transducer TonB [Massilia sp. TS11]|uniref:energy transducer TonB n=1 Tax=Massilia sp. TS11 TaxID=2908003 RepID=UPI001EDBFC95|nr:energy transducer TonB [Massilia sp. TS11]MCG2586695.1 energy transducer TonB [Massilia sp. TS11]
MQAVFSLDPLAAPAAPRKWRALLLAVGGHALAFAAIYQGMLHRHVVLNAPAEIFVQFAPVPAAPPAPPAQPLQTSAPLTPPSLFVPAVEPVQSAPTAPAASAAPDSRPVPPAPAVAVAAVAPAPAHSGPRLLTSGVEYLQPPQPVYPPMARRLGEQGKVVLRVLVNERGLAEGAQVQQSSGSARLDEAGRQAALGARFKPYLENGQAQSVYVLVTLNFQLQS